MDETIEKAYTTKEISLTLDIGSSTLRKWCLALEENGYLFARTDNQRRLFVDRDLVALRYFQKLVQGENFSLENAAKVIASKYKVEASGSRTPSVLLENEEEQRYFERSYDEDIEELKELITNQSDVITKQTELIKDLVIRMDQQQKYIDERLAKQDERLTKRDELLLESIKESRTETLKESQETKRLLLEAQTVAQEAKQIEEKKPRKGFMKWFSKE